MILRPKVRDLGGDATAKRRRIEARDLADGGCPRREARPHTPDVRPAPRLRSHARDHHPPGTVFHLCSRSNMRPSNGPWVQPAFNESFDTREGSLRDPVNEYRPDHETRDERADDRPTRTSPLMLDGNIHAFRARFESPPHVHPARDTPHVAIADFVGTRLHGHLRYPPR